MSNIYSLSMKAQTKISFFDKKRFNKYNEMRNIFIDIKSKIKYIKKNYKHNDNINIMKQLDFIIPKGYFGRTADRKNFHRIIGKILTQSQQEYIFKQQLIFCFYNRNTELTANDLLEIQIYLLDFIIKPFIRYYYKPIRILKSNEIRFIKRNEWQSFQQKAFQQLIDLKHLRIVEESTITAQCRGTLCLQPKNNNYRPIIRFRRRSINEKRFYKQLIRKIYNAINKYFDTTCTSSLYTNWLNFVRSSGNNKEIYGIKLDIKDAYGNISIDLLVHIVDKIDHQLFKENDKSFIRNYVQNQYVVYGKNGDLYKWEHGLLQGDPLSGPLCELYMTYMDNTYLQQFFNTTTNFLHRTVDDYFFCTDNQILIDEFDKKLTDLYVINDEKTIRHNQIVYYGKLFDLQTKQICKYYSFNKNYQIRYRFKLFNQKRPITNYKYLFRYLMRYSFNNNNFTKIELNTVYNTERCVLENYFNGMLLLAFKFDAINIIVKDYPNYSIDYVYQFLLILLKKYPFKIYNLLSTYNGVYNKNNITLKLLNCLARKAFCLVLKKRSITYTEILEKLFVPKYIDYGSIQDVDVTYFNKLPAGFQNICMNRCCKL